MRQAREVRTSLVGSELVTTDLKSGSWLQSGVHSSAGLLDFGGLFLCWCRATWGLALAAEPLHILHEDDLLVNWRVVALLMPCVIASIAEDDGVVGRAVASVAMLAGDIGLLLSGTTLTLSRSNGGWWGNKSRGRLDDSSRPAGARVVAR